MSYYICVLTCVANRLEKAEAALLLLVAAALAVAVALLLARLLARLAVLLTRLAGVLAGTGYTTGHLYLIRLKFFNHPGQKLMNAAGRINSCTMSITILLLDTETNGLPKNQFAPPSEFTAWPAILQLSWAVYRVAQPMVKLENTDVGISLDPGIPWDAGAAAIHGLTETEGRHGISATVALRKLAAAMRRVDVIIAHNLAFDKGVIRAAGYAEASRSPDASDLRTIWPSSVKELCTMRTTTNLVCIPPTAKQVACNITKYKSPRLNELYQWLFGIPYDISGSTLHSAKGDVDCLAQCIGELLRRSLITLP